jgi:diphosphomevalonate decarboxylase
MIIRRRGIVNKKRVVFQASPSLALIKYWGKEDLQANTPATPSLAVTLDGLFSRTIVIPDTQDSVAINGTAVEMNRYVSFFDALRHHLHTDMRFRAHSTNSFPTAAGLASSASGYAALTCACARLCGSSASPRELSAIARFGSASAARSLFGGFTRLDAGARHAMPIHDAGHWPELRIVVVAVTQSKKHLSSRQAMERSRITSPYFETWLSTTANGFERAVEAVDRRDLPTLGALMRASYLGMFTTMFTSTPPVIYWLPDSLEVIHMCERLRGEGIQAYETMDAGPQVKIVCEAPDLEGILARLADANSDWSVTVASPGKAPELVDEE